MVSLELVKLLPFYVWNLNAILFSSQCQLVAIFLPELTIVVCMPHLDLGYVNVSNSRAWSSEIGSAFLLPAIQALCFPYADSFEYRICHVQIGLYT
jgi:hypothetical protein